VCEGRRERKATGPLRYAFIAVAALIVYGSLYPWTFVFDAAANPPWVLLTSWRDRDPNDFPGRDFTVNVALYVPLGIAGYVAVKHCKRLIALGAPVLAALLLSAAVEMLQVYCPQRYCNGIDVAANVLGASIGVAFGTVFRETWQSLETKCRFRSPQPVPAAMLLLWAVYLLFPFFPELSPSVVIAKMRTFAADPLHLRVAMTAAIVFFTLGNIFAASGISAPRVSLWAMALLIPAQLVVTTRQPASAYFLGALLGCVCFSVFGKHTAAPRLACIAFAGLVLFRGLSPFVVDATLKQFRWIPFAVLIEAEDGQRGLLIALDKVCHYGTAICIVRAAGLQLRTATLLTACALACIEAVQVALPGRTPESTDPIMAALLGVTFWTIERERRSSQPACL
jgi:hypothetical protein